MPADRVGSIPIGTCGILLSAGGFYAGNNLGFSAAKAGSRRQICGPGFEHEIYRRAGMVYRDEIISFVENFEDGALRVS